MSEWQDITTAPKDGTEFLVGRDGMGTSVAFYRRSGQELVLEIDSKGHWPERPTHWQPSPPPPQNGANDGRE